MAIEFHPEDRKFNRANALYLAHASDIAYCRAPAADAMEKLGLETIAFKNKVTRTRGFLGVCDTHAVLAFRGTEPVTLPNWITDMVVKLVRCGEYEGRVHYGFSAALRKTWNTIESILDKAGDRPLFLTGHSMGGALAVLTGCLLAKQNRAPAGIYTFGAPRVGDPAFCTGYSLPTFRVVNRLDLIPEMPMASLKRFMPEKPRVVNEKFLEKLKCMVDRIPCYAHVDTLVYIDRDGDITLDADVAPWTAHALARAIATRGKSFHEGITDHMISNYIRTLEGKRVDRRGPIRRRRISQ